jgi:hypothetical protein
MPQLDILNWFHQVFVTTFLCLTFYYLLSLNYVPFFMGLLKSRTKIQTFRLMIISLFTLQINYFLAETYKSLQFGIANSLTLLWLYNVHQDDSSINAWLFRETALLADLEEILVQKEQVQI